MSIYEILSKNSGSLATIIIVLIFILKDLYGSNKKIIFKLDEIKDIKSDQKDELIKIKDKIEYLKSNMSIIDNLKNDIFSLSKDLDNLKNNIDEIIDNGKDSNIDVLNRNSKLDEKIFDLKTLMLEIKSNISNIQRDLDNMKYNFASIINKGLNNE
jgi:predicted RNase H-like nuclease (RuvC/YqgF family)